MGWKKMGKESSRTSTKTGQITLVSSVVLTLECPSLHWKYKCPSISFLRWLSVSLFSPLKILLLQLLLMLFVKKCFNFFLTCIEAKAFMKGKKLNPLWRICARTMKGHGFSRAVFPPGNPTGNGGLSRAHNFHTADVAKTRSLVREATIWMTKSLGEVWLVKWVWVNRAIWEETWNRRSSGSNFPLGRNSQRREQLCQACFYLRGDSLFCLWIQCILFCALFAVFI